MRPTTSLFAALLMAFTHVQSIAGTIGPISYRDIADSPFDLSRLGIDFFVEDFSHQLRYRHVLLADGTVTDIPKLTTPGVLLAGNSAGTASVWGFPRLSAFGTWAEDHQHANGVELTFNFDIGELGKFPQAVGFMIQNPAPLTTQFYSSSGTLIDAVTKPESPRSPYPGVPPQEWYSAYPQSFFVGAIYIGGIARITVSTPAIITYIDDFHYGQLTPEPPGLALAIIGTVAGLCYRAWRPSRRDLFPPTKPAALARPCADGG